MEQDIPPDPVNPFFKSHVHYKLTHLLDSYGGPAKFATKVHNHGTKWGAHGSLSFLNDWLVPPALQPLHTLTCITTPGLTSLAKRS